VVRRAGSIVVLGRKGPIPICLQTKHDDLKGKREVQEKILVKRMRKENFYKRGGKKRKESPASEREESNS